MVIEGNSPGTFFLSVRMDVRMDGRMDVSRVVDRDRINSREQKKFCIRAKKRSCVEKERLND